MNRPIRLSLLLVAAGLALASGSSAAALAANEIAYECDLDVCLLDPANPTAVTNLTFNGASSYDETPIWSPDGSRVAFVSDFADSGHGERNIFVMEPAAAGQAVNLAGQITSYSSGNKRIADLAWSPDGSRIAYTRGTNAGDDSVWVVNADGTTAFPLEIGGAGAKRHPSWSPDSSRIAYAVVKNAPEQIFLAPASGGYGPPLPNGVGHEPNWSPDGSRVAFDRPNSIAYVDLHIVPAAGGGSPLIVPGPYTEWTFSAWSPDGGRIAYRATGLGGSSTYRVINAGGGGDHPLASPGAGDARHASWSPDGSRLVYEGALISDIGRRDLYLANSDGSGGAVPLTSDGKSESPSWRVVSSTPQANPPPPIGTPVAPGTPKPKVVWFTKRIPWTPGRPLFVAIYYCPALTCSVSTEGKAKGAVTAGLRFRPATTGPLAKPKEGKVKRPRWVAVGRGKARIPGGQTRRLKLGLNKTGVALLKQRGKATIRVTIKAKAAGEAKPVTQSRTIQVVLKKKKQAKG